VTPEQALARYRQSHPPFEVGNEVARRHGAQAQPWRLQARADDLAAGLRSVVPNGTAADETTIMLLAVVLVRLERANEWLEREGLFANKRGEVWPVVRLVSSWENTATKLADSLGLNPRSRAGMKVGDARDLLGDYLAARAKEGEGA
jgi:hypothetical protein